MARIVRDVFYQVKAEVYVSGHHMINVLLSGVLDFDLEKCIISQIKEHNTKQGSTDEYRRVEIKSFVQLNVEDTEEEKLK